MVFQSYLSSSRQAWFGLSGREHDIYFTEMVLSQLPCYATLHENNKKFSLKLMCWHDVALLLRLDCIAKTSLAQPGGRCQHCRPQCLHSPSENWFLILQLGCQLQFRYSFVPVTCLWDGASDTHQICRNSTSATDRLGRWVINFYGWHWSS